LGSALTTWIFHLTHAVLLGVCIWAVFDTRFSLRDSQGKFDFNRDQMLPLYFLGALSIGYLTGYFLLIFKPLPQRGYRRESATTPRILNTASVTITCVLLVLVPLGLLYKNVPQIKITNDSAWRDYAAALTENLPPHAVVLSDRVDTLLLAQAWLARSGKAADYIFLETHSLRIPTYHRFQRARHPEIWPALTKEMYKDNFHFTDDALVDLLTRLEAKDPLYYLHPSFGPFFETFYQVPHGLVYELKQYPTNTVASPPPLSEDVFAENEGFWKKQDATFRKLLPFIAPAGPGVKPTFRDQWMQRMHIPFEKNPTAENLGQVYSRALDTLGVLDQRLGRLDAAGNHFAAAQEFSPNNLVATANLEFNRKLRSGERVAAESLESFDEHFGNFSGWEQILNVNGVFDTATGCLAQGIVFARGKLARQAAQQFERVLSLAPDNLIASLWLARTYLVSRTPEKALPLIAELKAHADSRDDAITPADVFRVELAADYKIKPQEIRPMLEQLSTTNMLDAAVQICIGFGDFTNALIVIEKRLGINPDNVPALVTDGLVHLRLGDSGRAIAPLTHAISLQPTNSDARLFRAVAYLENTNLEDATLDYETLKKTDSTKDASANYGLGEIAFRKGDTNTAIRLFEVSLTEMPTNSPGAKALEERIKVLKGGPP
jgi:tetratricopeptide (TPR) repeat protein